jgi:hypothetical protein
MIDKQTMARGAESVTPSGYVKARAKEPSTWAGFAALLEGLKLVFPQYSILIAVAQAVVGGAAVMMVEKGAASE